MTLQAAIEAQLPFLRAEAEARMTSRVTIKRENGTTTVGGIETPNWDTIHTGLPFRLGSGGSTDGGSRGVTIGGVTFEDATGVGHFPAATADLVDNDVIQVTSGEGAGEFHRIVAAVRYDQKTARRVPVVETQQPEGWSA